MSGWLHPAGPEASGTYWWRRAVVIAAVVVLLVLVVSLATRAAQGSEPTSAAPAAGPSTEIGPGPEPSTPTISGPSSPGADSPAPSTPTSSPRPTSSASSERSRSGDRAGSTSTSSASSSPSSTPTKAKTEVCDASKLRSTLQGDASPKVGAKVTFSLSLINGSGVSCAITRNAETMVLKVYSGTDRIWSTADCAKKVESADTVLKPEQATAWTITWDGSRSKSGCGTRPETPRPGTYFATFAYDGAKPVQQRMVLRTR